MKLLHLLTVLTPLSLVKILLLIAFYVAASEGAATIVNFVKYTGKKSTLSSL